MGGSDDESYSSGGSGSEYEFKKKDKKKDKKDKPEKKDKDKKDKDKDKKDKDKKDKDKKDKDKKDKPEKDKKDKDKHKDDDKHKEAQASKHYDLTGTELPPHQMSGYQHSYGGGGGGGEAASFFNSAPGSGDFHGSRDQVPFMPPHPPPPHPNLSNAPAPPFPSRDHPFNQAWEQQQQQHGGGAPTFPSANTGGDRGVQPHAQHQQGHSAPPSGYRIPLGPGVPFPSSAQARDPPFRDLGGEPVYVGSALFDNPSSVHPCKVAPHLDPPARIAYGGAEHEHRGRYDLLPIDLTTMEWIPTRDGVIPQGRRPVEGGYEENGTRLFHAYADIDGVAVPGKTGEHLGGANVPFGGTERVVTHAYFILCWR